MQEHRFGILTRPVSLSFGHFEIRPDPDFQAAQDWVTEYGHHDGYVYPPATVQLLETGEEVPRSRRPAHLFRMPASHVLLCNSACDQNDSHRVHASLVLQLIAYLYETCLQFDNWWFEARVPIRQHPLSVIRRNTEHFLSHAYDNWVQWPNVTRNRFVTTLFMFNRAPSYCWDWEHFTAQYMVFDSFFRTAVDLGLTSSKGGHAERFKRVCEDLGLAQSDSTICDFVRLRNDLFHEVLWDGGKPGSAGSGQAILCQFHLRKLNQCLIPAILGYKNEFSRSCWWSFARHFFAPP